MTRPIPQGVHNFIIKKLNHMSPKRVLIVEDEPAIAMDISGILQDEGYLIAGIAHNSIKALDLLKSRAIDVALLDISIKGNLDGIDIANIIKENYDIPFVFLTSFADKETLSRVMETTPYGYIVKPFKDRDLKPALEVALLRKQSEELSFPSLTRLNSKITSPLTKTEYEVAKLMWEGKTNQEVAEKLFVSINTIKTHIQNIYLKTETNKRGSFINFIREIS